MGLIYINISFVPDVKFADNEKLGLAVQQFRQEQKQLQDQFKYNCHLFMSELQNARPGHKQFVALNLVADNGKVVPAPSIIQPLYCKQLNTV